MPAQQAVAGAARLAEVRGSPAGPGSLAACAVPEVRAVLIVAAVAARQHSPPWRAAAATPGNASWGSPSVNQLPGPGQREIG